MRTIQEVIKSLNKKEIERAYFDTYPLNIDIDDADDIAICDYTQNVSSKFQQFLENICNHDINEGEQRAILFATKAPYDDSSNIICAELIHAKALLESEDVGAVETYAYEFTPWNEMLNFDVAETELTKRNLMDLVVDFLYEMSFFGFDEEMQKKERQKLEKSIEDAENNRNIKSFKSLEDVYEDLNIELYEEYPLEHDLRDKCMDAMRDYYRYCLNIELERVKQLLLND